MKNSRFIVRLSLLLLAEMLLGYYISLSFVGSVIQNVVFVLTFVLIIITLYLEINKQLIFVASQQLFVSLDVNKFDESVQKSEAFDKIALMKHSRGMLNAFKYIFNRDYDTAHKILFENNLLFNREDKYNYEYLYLLSILEYKRGKNTEFKKYFNLIEENIDKSKPSIINYDYILGLNYLLNNKKEAAATALTIAYENEKTNLIKIIIKEEVDLIEKL